MNENNFVLNRGSVEKFALFFLTIVFFILALLIFTGYIPTDNLSKNKILSVFGKLLLGVAPLLFAWEFFKTGNQIEVNNQGVVLLYWGKELRNYGWNQIKSLESKVPFAMEDYAYPRWRFYTLKTYDGRSIKITPHLYASNQKAIKYIKTKIQNENSIKSN